jgi:single-strand DNA-binding protein
MDLNRCEFIGRLGKDPDTRVTGDGIVITRFSLAVNRKWRDRDSGEQRKDTQWINIVAFRRLAEIASEFLHKGSRVFVAGEFRSSRWEQDGKERSSTEVVIRELVMLDSNPAKHAGPREPVVAGPTPSAPYRSWGQTHPAYKKTGDDDIPF